MNPEILVLLALGAGGGLLHALDADHVLAVSTVAVSGEASRRKILATAFNWALGHGLSLTLVSLTVLGFGLAIPETLSSVAEFLVGGILVAVGASLLLAFRRGDVRFSAHRHSGLPPHAHLHDRDHTPQGGAVFSDHRPILIGLVHGVAGSAPLIALLPLVIKSQFLFAGLYILLFTLCVALAMCLFGGVLGMVVSRLQARFRHSLAILQCLLAIQSIALGGYWMSGAL
jgi:nickel/cobalt transporter (NicO) family protein